MKLRTMTQARAAILGTAALLTVIVGVPLIVHAQGATPGATPAANDPLLVRGEEIFNSVCIACHQPDGKGIEGIYLPLAGNPAVTLDDPTYIITVLLNGRGGMPRFDTTYSDEDIAAIASFVRQNWENDAPAVSPDQVAAVRAQYATVFTPTPEGQIPTGGGRIDRGTPVATPQATPAS